jgi:hypothetical protein
LAFGVVVQAWLEDVDADLCPNTEIQVTGVLRFLQLATRMEDSAPLNAPGMHGTKLAFTLARSVLPSGAADLVEMVPNVLPKLAFSMFHGTR